MSEQFGHTTITPEDADILMYGMAYADITTSLLGKMARTVEPEIWASADIIPRLQSLKRAKDWFKAMMAVEGYQRTINQVKALDRKRRCMGMGR